MYLLCDYVWEIKGKFYEEKSENKNYEEQMILPNSFTHVVLNLLVLDLDL